MLGAAPTPPVALPQSIVDERQTILCDSAEYAKLLHNKPCQLVGCDGVELVTVCTTVGLGGVAKFALECNVCSSKRVHNSGTPVQLHHNEAWHIEGGYVLSEARPRFMAAEAVMAVMGCMLAGMQYLQYRILSAATVEESMEDFGCE